MAVDLTHAAKVEAAEFLAIRVFEHHRIRLVQRANIARNHMKRPPAPARCARAHDGDRLGRTRRQLQIRSLVENRFCPSDALQRSGLRRRDVFDELA